MLVVICLVIQLVNADLGTYKQNSCISIRVLNNCSSNNITEITNNNRTYIINQEMSKLGGQTFNYTFCNTSEIDTYTYSWYPNCYDCANGNCGNSFTVTPSGFSNLTTFYFIILLLAFGIMIFGFWIKDGWVVILGTLGLYLVGLFMILYGIDFIKDRYITYGLSLIVIAVASYISINSAIEQLG